MIISGLNQPIVAIATVSRQLLEAQSNIIEIYLPNSYRTMSNNNSKTVSTLSGPDSSQFHSATTLELAQALAEKLAISDKDWHQLKSNRQARALEQVGAALVFLLKDQPQEALPHLQQACGWLDRSISAPPCPSHGPKKS